MYARPKAIKINEYIPIPNNLLLIQPFFFLQSLNLFQFTQCKNREARNHAHNHFECEDFELRGSRSPARPRI